MNGTWLAIGAAGVITGASRLVRGSRAGELKRYHFDKGDIIIPAGKTYPDGALRVEGWDGEILKAVPIGGGFVYKFPLDRIASYDFEVITPARPSLRRLPRDTTPKWTKEFFFIGDPDDGVYEGYHWGQRWNGWAVPMFTVDVMRKIVKAMNNEEQGVDWGLHVLLDEPNGRVCMWNLYEVGQEAIDTHGTTPPLPLPGHEYTEELPWECFEGSEIDRRGIPRMMLYSIGDGWTWDDIPADEVEPGWLK
jgi:hypothetical protein